MPKRHLEAATAEERGKIRRRLGTLRQLTVQPSTRKRYDKALQGFFSFLTAEGLDLPKDKRQLDPIVCDYLETLWFEGKGRAQACDTLAALQDSQPGLRNNLPGAWRLLRTWQANEIPSRAPPLPEHIVLAMAGWSLFHGWVSFALSLLIGFYSMLRTGEILGLASSRFQCTEGQLQALISLGLTKGGKRHGAAESVVLGLEPVVRFLRTWKKVASASTRLTPAPAKWRALFNSCLAGLGIEHLGFRPYSLRRGGATYWFQKHHNLDRILLQGRWHTQKSARIYLNEGLSVLAQMNVPKNDPKLKPFLTVYSNFIQSPKFSTLEPPSKGGRTGGRGRGTKDKSKSARKRD